MCFDDAIERYLADMQLEGRLNSPHSVKKYGISLRSHAADVDGRDPSLVTREDIKRTLRRWPHPNTRGYNRSILVSFYDWATEEGLCGDNPVRKTRAPRRRPIVRTRLTEREAARLLSSTRGVRERRAIFLALCAGLRNAELRGLQGRHFARPDFIWVAAPIAKGQRERYIPVLPELRPVVDEIRENVSRRHYVLPALAPPFSADPRLHPSSTQALRTLVARVASRARIRARVTPHTLRHAFAERVARDADARIVQHLLGHARLESTELYLRPPTLDRLSTAVQNVRYQTDAG